VARREGPSADSRAAARTVALKARRARFSYISPAGNLARRQDPAVDSKSWTLTDLKGALSRRLANWNGSVIDGGYFENYGALTALELARAAEALGRLLGQQPHDPGMLLRMLPGVSNNGCCTDDEQPSEIAISLLGDAAKPFLAPRRMLPRYKSDPCCKIPTGLEGTRVCDSGSDGRGPDHAYPGHGLETAAHIIGTMMGVNGAIESCDLQFQSSELIDNGLQRLFHRRWKSFAITLVRDDLGKLRETFASRLRNEAELGKMGSKRIDQLRALAD
jgi:hypothetical protein